MTDTRAKSGLTAVTTAQVEAELARLGRREFSVAAALALLGGATITVSGCGGGGGNPAGSSSNGDVAAAISANHGHSAVITAAQLTAGNALALDIRGSAAHSHAVELSAAEIAGIRGRGTVAKASTMGLDPGLGDHQHTVTFDGATRDPGDGGY